MSTTTFEAAVAACPEFSNVTQWEELWRVRAKTLMRDPQFHDWVEALNMAIESCADRSERLENISLVLAVMFHAGMALR